MANIDNNIPDFFLNNYAKEIKDINDLTAQLKQLNIHGISTPYNDASEKFKKHYYQRIYYIPVFQQKILGSFTYSSKNKHDNWINSSIIQNTNNVNLVVIKKFRTTREEKRVKRIAIRAVYALNLDYGVVKVGLTVGEKPWVMYVNPLPNNNTLLKLFESAIKQFKKIWQTNINKIKNEVVLGCDPEYILQDSLGKLVLASKYLPKYGSAGCDRIWTNNDRTQLPLAELRPIPSKEPRQLVLNLYKCFLISSKKITDRQLKWLAGAMPIKNYPLGGHIHLSNISVNSFLLRALDNYLTITITLFEDKKGISRRPQYGFLGDYRDKYHSGFEYRTLPSWLVSPTITKGVFALTKLISENYLYLYQNPLEELYVQKAYYRGDKSVLRPVVKNLWNELKQLNDFSKYERYLIPIENYINNNFEWDESKDIRQVWFLPPYHKEIYKINNFSKKGSNN